MKALVYTGPKAMAFQDAADPAPNPGETLVRVDKVGICGSDMHGYLGHDARRPAPLILGHEATGVIEGGPRDGERVTINPLVECLTCPACKTGRQHICENRQLISMPPRQGAFAELVAMPDKNLVTIPDDMPFEKAALAEPLSVCWHAAKLGIRVANWPVERALVIGGGAIGLGSALALQALTKADVTISEPNDGRRSYLTDTCGQKALAPDALGAGGFDLIVDAVGYAATRAPASELVRPGGTIVHVGLGDGEGGFDIRRATLQEITFAGSYCYTPDEFRETVAAMSEGRLGTLDWTEERPLDAGAEAFADILAGRVAAPKIILNPK